MIFELFFVFFGGRFKAKAPKSWKSFILGSSGQNFGFFDQNFKFSIVKIEVNLKGLNVINLEGLEVLKENFQLHVQQCG